MSSRKQVNQKQNTISCRVRNHSNFLGVINRATLRLGLRNHSRQTAGHLVGDSAVRCICLDSATPDISTSDPLNQSRKG